MLGHMPGAGRHHARQHEGHEDAAWHVAAAAVAVLCMRLTRMLTLSILAAVAALWALTSIR
jgi:branched-subunit amino acid transport protein